MLEAQMGVPSEVAKEAVCNLHDTHDTGIFDLYAHLNHAHEGFAATIVALA